MPRNASADEPIPTLAIDELGVDFHTGNGRLHALRRVSLTLEPGTVLGVVGESGCGKSTLVGAILGLLPANAEIVGGTIALEGQDLRDLAPRRLQSLRGTRMAVVFQDPMSSLNPVLTIGAQLVDFQHAAAGNRAFKRRRAADMLERVGIPDARQRLAHYPHQFSGGMRQRIAIAAALLARPALLIADEPTTALDATTEAQILRLLRELQDETGCSLLFISHQLGVVAHLCDEVVVMYAGEVVEHGSVRDVFHRPSHPYTRRLLACDPARLAAKSAELETIPGRLPELTAVATGCIFAARCSEAIAVCHERPSPAHTIAAGHRASCHLLREEG